MPENVFYPRLCGGTFYVLLRQAVKQRNQARKNCMGENDGLSEPEMFKGLIRVFVPDFSDPARDSFKTNTSKYKKCAISSSAYLPFQEGSYISVFDAKVRANDLSVLQGMTDFADRFVDCANECKCNHLVKALLDLILQDSSISDTDVFYIESGGIPCSKAALRTLTKLSFYSFLLGIWHFIVTNRRDNTIGQDTYEHWHAPVDYVGQTRPFIGTIGAGITAKIALEFDAFDCDTVADDSYDSEIGEAKPIHSEQEPPQVEHTHPEPVVIHQHGNNNVAIGYINTLTINSH